MEISSEDIRRIYDNNNEIWPKNDKWHYYTRNKIAEFIKSNQKSVDNSLFVINAGSSGETYGIPDEKTLHIDIVGRRIENKQCKLIMDLNDPIPYPDECTDLIICVGSVINYIDVIRLIKEFARLLKNKGQIILEFESSNTFELLFSGKINQNAVIIKTFYRNEPTTIWYYSEKWIRENLRESGLEVMDMNRWHRISPLLLKITGNPNFSQWFSKLDCIFSRIPYIRKYSSNIILCIKKTT